MNHTYISSTRLVQLVTMFGFILVGCHTMTIPNDRVEPVESFPLKAEKQGLVIAIRPVRDKKEIEESFHTELLDKGILPIQVQAKNKNPSSSFVLSRDKIVVVDRKSLEPEGQARAKGGAVSSESIGVGTATTGTAIMAGTIGIVPVTLGTPAMIGTVTGAAIAAGAAAGGGLIGLGLIAGGLKMLSDAQVIENNLAMKQFYSHTLGPGNTSYEYGYVYFQLPKSEKSNKKYQVLIEATESGTGKAMTFMFPLEY